MSNTLQLVKRLVEGKDIQISAHGYDELAADDIKDALSPAVVITAYRPIPAKWSADFLRRK